MRPDCYEDGLAAGEAADPEVPGVALYSRETGRANGGSAVLAAQVSVPIQQLAGRPRRYRR
jgi:hypothetical protein